jgi:hypothetical protein
MDHGLDVRWLEHWEYECGVDKEDWPGFPSWETSGKGDPDHQIGTTGQIVQARANLAWEGEDEIEVEGTCEWENKLTHVD